MFAAPKGYCAIWHSQDGGTSWNTTNLTACSVSAISFSTIAPTMGYLVAGSNTAKTTDGGNSWVSAASLPACCAAGVSVDPNNPNTVYAISGLGVWKSTDSAGSWNLASNTVFALNTPTQLAVAPTNPATIYASAALNQSGFVAKLNSTGTGLLYSTYLAGGGNTTIPGGIAVDNAGTAVVAGYTTDTGFPTTPGAIQLAKQCCADAFVARISDATAACTVTFSGSVRSYSPQGAAQDALAVVAPSGCAWTVSTATPWIHLMNGISGAGVSNTGVGTVFFSVDRNTGTTSRTGTITAGGQTFTINQAAAPLLDIFLGHTGNFTQGQLGAIYTIAVTNNAAAGPTSGTVTVQANVPSGLLFVSMSGTGWTCAGTSCSRSDTLAPGGSYPLITMVVNVASNAASTLTNEAFVSGGGMPTTVFSDNFTSIFPNPVRFVPVLPCRVADTRKPDGPYGGPIIGGGAMRSFNMASSGCGIPANAQAYSLNVTVVPPARLGYLTVWPTGETKPLVSTLNSLDGRIKSNAAVVPAGANNSVSVFASDTTHVVLDINGYFVPASDVNALAFFPVVPCRIADTRTAAGPLGGPFMPGGSNRTFPILSAPCGIPATAKAYALNFVALPRGGGRLGYLTVYPTGQPQPLVSSLNAPTGTVTANAVIVPSGTAGSIDVFAADATDLVIDVNGYFAPMTTGGLSMYNVTPCRLLDTRQPPGSPPFSGVKDVNATTAGCDIPGSAQAHALSVTVVPPGPLGYLTIWPQGQPQPLASTLNALDGAVTSNLAIVRATGGIISVFASDLTHLVLDIFGYFAP